jgi:hypothetical protein
MPRPRGAPGSDPRPGIYNIADDDGVVAKARAALGFDPQFRL